MPPNVVLVCIDTVRADHTSAYGYGKPTTPELERIAAEGLLLRHHFANASWTKPSVASILSGLHPSAHGSREGQFSGRNKSEPASVDVLAEGLVLLPEAFAEAGYRTVAHVTNYNMLERFGYAQGYDDYRFVENATLLPKVNGSDRDAIGTALEVLKDSEQPVFAWVHLMSVHQYQAPEELRIFESETETPIDHSAPGHGRVRDYTVLEKALADYDASIRYTDSLVGELFDFIRTQAPNTVLVITSDHGEEFYDHGGFEHGTSLYNELLAVPCVLWGPGVPRGEVLTGISDSLDLYPTLLELAGIESAGRGLPGRSVIENGRPAGKSTSFGEQHQRGLFRRYSLVQDGKKLIESRHKRKPEQNYSELFADGLGPELELIEEESEERARMRDAVELLKRAAEDAHAQVVGETARAALDQDDLDRLRALGYAGEEEDE